MDFASINRFFKVSHSEFLTQAATSILLIVVGVILKSLAQRAVQGWDFHSLETKRRWLIHIRNLSGVLIFGGLVLIWATELKTFTLSLVAVAAALVIGLKEVLVCVLGGALRASSNLFSIGDRIEVGVVRGDVIDVNLLTTSLLEIGPGKDLHQYTGRKIVIPNSMLFTSPVINETATSKFVLHVFSIPCGIESEWRELETRILDAARIECALYIEECQTYFEEINRAAGLDTPSVHPRVSFAFRDEKRVDLIVRIPVPALRKGRIEQAIIRRVFLTADHPSE